MTIKINPVYESRLDFKNLTITADTLLQTMGYRHQPAPDNLRHELSSVMSELPSLAAIRGGYVITAQHNFQLQEDGFVLDTTFFHTGRIIAANLKQSEYLALFTATAGEPLSEKIAALNQQHQLLTAYLYDVCGSELAEQAAAYLQACLAAQVQATGLGITNRYSPGYCEWDVAEQQKLFSFLPAGFCGITLTASSVMIPLKSVSGIIGIGKNAVKRDYGCALCTLESCYKRREV